MSLIKNLLDRAGFLSKGSEPSLWIIGDQKDAFLKIKPLLDDMIERHVRLSIILSPRNVALKKDLEHFYPHHKILPLPFNNPFSIRMFLAQSDIRAAVFLDGIIPADMAIVDGLKKRSIALVVLSAFKALSNQARLDAEKTCEVVVELVTVGTADAKTKYRQLTVQRTNDVLWEMLGRNLKLKREQNAVFYGLHALLLKMVKHKQYKHWLNWYLVRYSDIDQIASALNYPDTIMCLGNGPSSEDDRLSEIPYDALFRVNHSWRKRGLFSRADVVFTGRRPSIRAVRNAIFGVQSEGVERRLIGTRIFNFSMNPTRFFNVNAVSPFLMQFNWGTLRPTNGASMVAAAVALQPKTLIVAGIDLFQHPQGTYPGDTVTPNDYAPAHDVDAELNFLRELFDTYQGELVIISEILQSRLSQSEDENKKG